MSDTPNVSPNTPPTNGDRKAVYESADNPVMRERGGDSLRQGINDDVAKKFFRVYIWMAAIMVTLFVPPDQRVEVLKQVPNALSSPPSLFFALIHQIGIF